VAETSFRCVLLAESHPGLAERVRGLLAAWSETVVLVGDEPSLLESSGRLQPELVVVDLSVPLGGDLRWVRRLRLRCPGAKVVVLSQDDDADVRSAVKSAGVDGFVPKGMLADGLVAILSDLQADWVDNPPS